MTPYRLISQEQLAAFGDALARNGWHESDFELEEGVFEQATAEVEAALGEVGVKCLRTEAVAIYRIGPGLDWVGDFDTDLRAGKMGRPARTNDAQ
jgi:hypothetical protein